ncbi:MAG TPA: hypothetical protein VFP98_10690 [Candidatus Polarisedimenticolia bacterium]|nr:hypothetical protein [Candidatus Polarisedimenticolia bacterium]
MPRSSTIQRLAVACFLAACAGAALQAAEPARALIIVRTLVIDGLGTRAVDTDSARIPFGSRGLLVKRVPYAGPPLSFRLAVQAGPPQESGIPLTLSAEVWSGDASPIPEGSAVTRREEAAMVAAETSYLMEIEHDPIADRRIVLSITARKVGEDEALPPPGLDPGETVHFLLEVIRESGGRTDPPDTHELSAAVGHSSTYSSGIRFPARAGPGPAGAGPAYELIGVSITLTPERVLGQLVTVKVGIQGSEYVDATRTRLEPINHVEVFTVTSGSIQEFSVTVPKRGADPAPAAANQPVLVPVTYLVRVIPTVG